MKNVYFLGLALFLASCSTSKNSGTTASTARQVATAQVKQELQNHDTFKINSYSQDKTYGYEQKNPIKVGGVKDSEGPMNERRFLNALAGPNGETISYSRKGSCCHFETPNGLMGGGLLDMYLISYEGLPEPITLYINMYDSDSLKVPTGFTLK